MIKLNWTIFLQFANFIILLAILNFILYRPFRRIIDERRGTIGGSLQRAKDLESQINDKMARYQERLQEAKLRGNQEKAALRQQAMEEEGRALGEARERANEHVQKIRGQVQAETDSARQTLSGEAQMLAGQIATKVLGRAV